jgi:hypothetical protein
MPVADRVTVNKLDLVKPFVVPNSGSRRRFVREKRQLRVVRKNCK